LLKQHRMASGNTMKNIDLNLPPISSAHISTAGNSSPDLPPELEKTFGNLIKLISPSTPSVDSRSEENNPAGQVVTLANQPSCDALGSEHLLNPPTSPSSAAAVGSPELPTAEPEPESTVEKPQRGLAFLRQLQRMILQEAGSGEKLETSSKTDDEAADESAFQAFADFTAKDAKTVSQDGRNDNQPAITRPQEPLLSGAGMPFPAALLGPEKPPAALPGTAEQVSSSGQVLPPTGKLQPPSDPQGIAMSTPSREKLAVETTVLRREMVAAERQGLDGKRPSTPEDQGSSAVFPNFSPSEPIALPSPPAAAFSANASASPSAATPELPLQLGREGWGITLGHQLLWLVQHRAQRAELKLNPPHLGPLEVHLSLDRDQTQITFFCHDSGVRHTLEGALPRLKEMLQSQGLELHQASVFSQSSGYQQSSERPLNPQRTWFVDDDGSPKPDPAQLIAARLKIGMVDDYV
jgi:hypothetical protein